MDRTPALAAEPFDVPEAYEIRVFEGPADWHLVGAIELVSPGNKDRESKIQAFVTKCAAYLHAGVSVVIVDVVTSRRVNCHDRLIAHLNISSARMPDDVSLYASAYRPVERDGKIRLGGSPRRGELRMNGLSRVHRVILPSRRFSVDHLVKDCRATVKPLAC